MLTAEYKFKKVIPAELRNLPEKSYPSELIKEWDKEVEATKAALAAGEIIPLTAEEFAAEYGISLKKDKS